jgi:four helix bundle protein
VAQGSLAETETLLILAHRLGYLPAESQRDLQDRASEIGRMLSGLTKSLRSKR